MLNVFTLCTYLSFTNVLLCTITLIEVFINFKRPYDLKIWFVLFVTTILILNAFFFLRMVSIEFIWLYIFSGQLLKLTGINIISYISDINYKKIILVVSLILFFICLAISFFIYDKENNYSGVTRNDILNVPYGFSSLSNVPSPFYLILRNSANILYSILYLVVIQKTIILYHAKRSTNIFQLKIKNWLRLCFIYLSVVLIITLVFQFFTDEKSKQIKFLISLILLFSGNLYVLFRPKQINNSLLKRSSNILKTRSRFNYKYGTVDYIKFTKLFFLDTYYLDDSASLLNFANKYNFDKNDIHHFVSNNYNTSFSELIEKSRVDFFVELAKTPKGQHSTIEVLAKESGFPTRQALYKPFEKYHGGKPSDIMP